MVTNNKKAQTFAIRLSVHHKPYMNTGNLRPQWVQFQYHVLLKLRGGE